VEQYSGFRLYRQADREARRSLLLLAGLALLLAAHLAWLANLD